MPVLRNQLFNNGAPFASLAVDFVTVKHPMYEPSALQASFDHPTRIFVALFAGGDYGHGVFPKSPQSSGVLTDFDGRSQIAASVGKEPLAADNPTGPTIASAFVTSLRRVIGASTSDQAHLIDQERSDWLPIFERAVSPLVENMADVDLEALFDLRIIKLYLRPETCSDAELLRFRPQWAMRPSVTQIATFIDKYLANSSLSEAKANRASRRRQEIATGLVANQLRHEALKDDPWTRPSSFRSTKLPALAARRTGALKALQIILDAGPIAAVLHGLDDSATSHIMVVELDALFAPSLPQHLFEPGLWSNIFRQTTEEHRAGSWEPPKRGKVMRDRKAKRTLSTESRLLEGQQVRPSDMEAETWLTPLCRSSRSLRSDRSPRPATTDPSLALPLRRESIIWSCRDFALKHVTQAHRSRVRSARSLHEYHKSPAFCTVSSTAPHDLLESLDSRDRLSENERVDILNTRLSLVDRAEQNEGKLTSVPS